MRWPEGVRVDAGYEEGSVVSDHYDPLLAKVIARGEDRSHALDALAEALARTEILGVRTNIPFLLRYLSHSEVRAGRVTTTFVERELPSLVPHGETPDEATLRADAMILGLRLLEGVSLPEFAARFGARAEDVFAPAIERHTRLGLIERAGDRLRLTPRGLLLSNEVFVDLLPDS